jgi:CheY-like chemotaxis protein
MTTKREAVTVLLADDDPDDRMLVEEAFAEIDSSYDLRFVDDGEELMDYLRHEGRFLEDTAAPKPALILLDLNMPKKDGREAASEIKADPALRQIPIVVLTTSTSEEDVHHTYGVGVNSFVSKPVTFDGMLALAREVSNFWIETIDLPPSPSEGEDG